MADTEHKPDEVPEVIGDPFSPDVEVDQTPAPDVDRILADEDNDFTEEA